MLSKTIQFKGDSARILEIFSKRPHTFLLDSSLTDARRGRYSFWGSDPFFIVRQKGKDSLAELKRNFYRFASKDFKSSLTPLSAGIVGYLSYDFGLHAQKFEKKAIDDLNLPDCLFGFYDVIVTFDHVEKLLHITSSGLPETNARLKMLRAKERLDETLRLIEKEKFQEASTPLHMDENIDWQSNFTKENYVKAVRQALDHIACGDIYQVNLAQRFHARLTRDKMPAVGLYESLRAVSPTHFGAYFNAEDFEILSSSPEEFLTLQGSFVQTRPMKGTRPRGKNSEEDKRIKKELLFNQKEIAELLMVTDLERNDLGKVCAFGSVKVKEMRTIEEYDNVFQATSSIEGKLQAGKNCFDLLEAAFPSGSVTGCPKIKAMQVIDSLEPTRRGMYTGSLGYISFDESMKLNVLIRTLLLKGNDMFLQTGGGIVADSNPQAEYEETILKAEAIRLCLNAYAKRMNFSSTFNFVSS